MDDKAIKQRLKDAGLLLHDASKAWPRHRKTALLRMAAALRIVESVREHMDG